MSFVRVLNPHEFKKVSSGERPFVVLKPPMIGVSQVGEGDVIEIRESSYFDNIGSIGGRHVKMIISGVKWVDSGDSARFAVVGLRPIREGLEESEILSVKKEIWPKLEELLDIQKDGLGMVDRHLATAEKCLMTAKESPDSELREVMIDAAVELIDSIRQGNQLLGYVREVECALFDSDDDIPW